MPRMNTEPTSFFSHLYSSIETIAKGNLDKNLAGRISTADVEAKIRAEAEDPNAYALILLCSYRRNRVPAALAAFFAVRPVKEQVDAAIARLQSDHPTLLSNEALGTYADALHANLIDNEVDDADDADEHDNEDEDEDALDLNIGFESLSVISTILLGNDSKAHPAIHFCMRDRQTAVLLDRAMPVTDGLFLSSAILDACVESMESYMSTVKIKKWPASIRQANVEYIGDLSKTLERLRSLSVRLTK